MARAPGYHAAPHHRIRELPLGRRLRVLHGGETLADSRDVLRVEEDGHPARHYFPRGDVQISQLERTQTSTRCPFKGTASYFTLNVGGHKLEDAVWSYEDPYEEHAALKGRLAFQEERLPQLELVFDD